MALSPYRNKWNPESNIPRDTRISGMFTLTTAGAPLVTRPSAVSDSATGGFGFTVAQQATYYSLTGGNVYVVTFTEQYKAPLIMKAWYTTPYAAGTGASSPGVAVFAQCTDYDSTTNSFVVYLVNGSGVIQSDAGATIAAGTIGFEGQFLNTISPPSN